VEPTEEQYLILNALDTLELIDNALYDEDNGIWIIQTPSSVLPISQLLQNGEIIPFSGEQ
jgi:hypothetical protein